MKRKNLKPMIISALLAVGFGATSVGTSFALFTDHADTSISVTAGKVDVDFSLANLAKTSADAGADVKTMTDENGAQYGEQAGWVNGGDATFNPTTGFLELDKMTPGDKVAFGASFRNSSNVAIKYRLVIQAEDTSDYLIKGLNFKVGETSIKALKTYKSAWTVLAAPSGEYEDVALGAFAIEMPITAGNSFQNLSTSYNIGIEAVQANALTEEGEEIIAGDLNIIDDTTGNPVAFLLLEDFTEAVNGGTSYAGKTVKLNDSINLAGAEWTPVGTKTHPFDGTFDGNGKTISNLSITSVAGSTFDAQGLFGVTSGAKISDLTLDNINISSNFSDKGGVGALVGVANNGIELDNITVTNATLSAKYAGAIVGFADASNHGQVFKDCDAKGSVSGTRAGGIIGRIDNCDSTSFDSCSFEGTVNANTGSSKYAGGFVGQKTGGNPSNLFISFIDCAVNATVTGECYGDLFGFSQSGYYVFNLKKNNVSVTSPVQLETTLRSSVLLPIDGTIYYIESTDYTHSTASYDSENTTTVYPNGSSYYSTAPIKNTWYRATNAYLDLSGNVCYNADGTVYRGTKPVAGDGQKIQQRTYVSGHDYARNRDIYSFDMWRVVLANQADADGWYDNLVLTEGTYFQDPTQYVDSNLYEISSYVSETSGMTIYLVSAK